MASDTVKKSQNIILKQDWSQTVISARNYTSLKHIVCSDLVAASWCSHWDRDIVAASWCPPIHTHTHTPMNMYATKHTELPTVCSHYTSSQTSTHQAAYDAYITGFSMLAMSKMLGTCDSPRVCILLQQIAFYS